MRMYCEKCLKSVAAFAVCFCLLCSAVFMKAEAESLACDCTQEVCACFLQVGDGGGAMRAVIAKLTEKGYLCDKRIKTTYTVKVKIAVEKFQSEVGLLADGLMNDETLRALLGDAVSAGNAHSDDVVWVSSRSGVRYHAKKTCSGMRNPRKMSGMHAQLLMLEPCGICIK